MPQNEQFHLQTINFGRTENELSNVLYLCILIPQLLEYKHTSSRSLFWTPTNCTMNLPFHCILRQACSHLIKIELGRKAPTDLPRWTILPQWTMNIFLLLVENNDSTFGIRTSRDHIRNHFIFCLNSTLPTLPFMVADDVPTHSTILPGAIYFSKSFDLCFFD